VEPPFLLTHRDAPLPVSMPSSRTLLIGLAVLLVVGIGGVAFAGCTTIQIQEEDVFLPKPSITPQTFTSDTVNLREVYVDNDSVRLNAWHLTRPDARGTILFFGGNGFYLVQSRGYVEALTDFPVNVLMFDYRGYGKSTGAPGVEGFKSDALRMYDYAVDSLDAAPERMLVHGHSLGTFMASHTAAERDVAGVVLENPATDVQGWINGLAPWFVRLFVDFEIAEPLQDESNIAVLKEVDVPLLVFAGENDNVTRPEMAKTLYEEAISSSKNLVVVDSAGHNFLYRDSTYTAAYQNLLDGSLPAGDAGTISTSAK
jgi:fermentation-respiration switch protein FrsA (DUF1100 family)